MLSAFTLSLLRKVRNSTLEGSLHPLKRTWVSGRFGNTEPAYISGDESIKVRMSPVKADELNEKYKNEIRNLYRTVISPGSEYFTLEGDVFEVEVGDRMRLGQNKFYDVLGIEMDPNDIGLLSYLILAEVV
jgi:hypothetical protein